MTALTLSSVLVVIVLAAVALLVLAALIVRSLLSEDKPTHPTQDWSHLDD